jgi:hypothetical protein
MSAASFLGISGLVFLSGYDGLIYSIGFLVGWPIILFLIAERLRNLGKYTFADVVSYRLQQTADTHCWPRPGSLDRGRCFYLIAQMVGAGKLIQVLFGLPYDLRGDRRRCADGHVRHLRRHDCHHLGADHQGGPAAPRARPSSRSARHVHGFGWEYESFERDVHRKRSPCIRHGIGAMHGAWYLGVRSG